MASDFGDESGEKLFDFMVRLGMRMGEDAMHRHANKLQAAFENAKGGTQVEPRGADAAVEWAKLDMHEFQEIEGYDEIKGVIDTKLKANGVEPAWFQDQAAGKEYLLFRIAEAQQVWDLLDEFSRETEGAESRASQQLKRALDERRDSRPLEEKAKEAREAADALEREAGKPQQRARDPRFQETRSR
ncbi:MAG: hypothetical protein E6Y86_06680 [Slackia sp.]|uniref:hypothetical protein n=1 Tax=uncultured Slackia sp. TaxID=665903 RepID=UPI0028060DE3|nr:hypothetical protein [uncultured Slackia sp.]MDU6011714.1 hypothetical protein [Slackia sp.]